MAISKDTIEKLILADFPDAEVEIKDLVGDQDHYELKIKSSRFSGMNTVAQHKLVYKALDGYVGGQLHALAIKTIVK